MQTCFASLESCADFGMESLNPEKARLIVLRILRGLGDWVKAEDLRDVYLSHPEVPQLPELPLRAMSDQIAELKSFDVIEAMPRLTPEYLQPGFPITPNPDGAYRITKTGREILVAAGL